MCIGTINDCRLDGDGDCEMHSEVTLVICEDLEDLGVPSLLQR